MQCQWHLYNPHWFWQSVVVPGTSEMGKAQSTARQIRSNPVVQQRVRDATRPKVDKAVVREPPSREYLEKAGQLDAVFGDRLKHVFVTSTDTNADMNLPADRPKPQDRLQVTSQMPHTQSVEGGMRAPNKLLVEEIKTILVNHRDDPSTWTVEYIADKFDVDRTKIAKLLANNSALRVHSWAKQKLMDDQLSEAEKAAKDAAPKPKLNPTYDEFTEAIVTRTGKRKLSAAEVIERMRRASQKKE